MTKNESHRKILFVKYTLAKYFFSGECAHSLMGVGMYTRKFFIREVMYTHFKMLSDQYQGWEISIYRQILSWKKNQS